MIYILVNMCRNRIRLNKNDCVIYSLYLLVVSVYISISLHLPVSIYTEASHDDLYFIKNAYGIINGNWLGPYNQMTLIKGPIYSFLLSANSLIGVPITLTLSLVYTLSCLIIANILKKNGLNSFFSFFLVSVLLFHPVLFPTRIIRDNIYPSLTLLVISGILSLAPNKKNASSFVKTILFGLALGAFWFTREEGVWIIPGAALFISYKLLATKRGESTIPLLLRHFAVYSLAAFSVYLIIALINYTKYNTFDVVDFKSNSFKKVLKALNSVSVGPDIRYLPVSHEKREEIYKVSSAFHELKTYLEDPDNGWKKPGCGIYPHTCGDYAGGWFMWALRDAAAITGHYASPETARNFYDQITSEIELACKDGAIKCASNPIPFLPVMSKDSVREIPRRFLDAIRLTLYQKPIPQTDGDSWGPIENLNNIRLFLGFPKSTSASEEQTINFRGWYYSSQHDWIYLKCGTSGEDANIPIKRRPSSDIADHFIDPSANYQRFDFTYKKSDTCVIKVTEGVSLPLDLNDITQKTNLGMTLGNGTIYFDEITIHSAEKYVPYIFDIKQYLVTAYKAITPAIASIGIFCWLYYVFISFLKQHDLNQIFWAASMLWLIYLTRIFLIVLVDVSSFPAVNYLYLMSVFPVLNLASFSSFALVMNKKILQLSPSTYP